MPDLLQQVQEQAAAKRAKAGEDYRTILLRAEDPRPGDVERLNAAMGELDFTPGRLESDLCILKKAAGLESQAAEANADLAAAVEAASDASTAYREETKQILREREHEEKRLWSEFTALQRRQTAGQEAGRELAVLRRKHWALFGEVRPVPEPEKSPMMLAPVLHNIGQPAEARPASVTPVHAPRLLADGSMRFGPLPENPRPAIGESAVVAVVEQPALSDGGDDWEGDEAEGANQE